MNHTITGTKRNFRLSHIKAQTQIKRRLHRVSSHRPESMSFPGTSQQGECRNGVTKHASLAESSLVIQLPAKPSGICGMWGSLLWGWERGWSTAHATALALTGSVKRARWVKVSWSVAQSKQVIYSKQQIVLIIGCLKTSNCSVPPLCHLNPFSDRLAPTYSIFPFQGNRELLDRSSDAWCSTKLGCLTASKALGGRARSRAVPAIGKGESPVP